MDMMARDSALAYRLFKQKLMHMFLPVRWQAYPTNSKVGSSENAGEAAAAVFRDASGREQAKSRDGEAPSYLVGQVSAQLDSP